MQLIDTHCHLDTDAFNKDRLKVIEQCRQRGVDRIVVPAIAAAGWLRLLMLCETQEGLYPALGLHPMFLQNHKDNDLKLLDKWLYDHRRQVVAVGEIGLDYYDKQTDRKQQQELFESQLKSAQKAELPVILHVRKAHDRVLKTLAKIPVRGGIVHAFNGSEQQAEKYISQGFKLGFGGTMTYDNAHRIHRLVRQLPIEAMVLETDAPDMVVSSHRGQRNSPAYLVEIVNAMSALRNEPALELAWQTTDNAVEVLALD